MTAPPRPPATSDRAAPCANTALASWLASLDVSNPDGFDPRKSTSYSVIWHRWVQHLSRQSTPWHRALATDVLDFVSRGIHPVATRGSRTRRTAVSPVTQRRYFRVLSRIYHHALTECWMTHNPAAGVAQDERPPTETSRGFTLSDALWQALPHFFGLDTKRAHTDARDQALLWVLYDTGMTPQELRSLTPACIQIGPPYEGRTPMDGPLKPWPHVVPSQSHCVRVRGERGAHQDRLLHLSDSTVHALQTWQSMCPFKGEEGPLFVTERRTSMSAVGLFQVVAETVSRAHSVIGQCEPPRFGPQAMRNTCLVLALKGGLSVDEVLAGAGLHERRALDRLNDVLNAPGSGAS